MTAGDPLQVLTEARVLADIDRLFARSMADLGAGPEVVLAAAAVSALHRAGHTCLPLSEAGRSLADIVERPASDQEEVPAHARAVRLPARDAWRAALEASPVVANGGGTGSQLPRGADPDRRPSPLVLDHDRLYLHRLFEAESGLATRMRARAADLTPCDLGDALARVFGAAAHPATVAAARAAVERRLGIGTGGPGTRKTKPAAGARAAASGGCASSAADPVPERPRSRRG